MSTVGSPYLPLYRLERRYRRRLTLALLGGSAFTLLLLFVLHLALRELGA